LLVVGCWLLVVGCSSLDGTDVVVVVVSFVGYRLFVFGFGSNHESNPCHTSSARTPDSLAFEKHDRRAGIAKYEATRPIMKCAG
jgi:hypothetical protein